MIMIMRNIEFRNTTLTRIQFLLRNKIVFVFVLNCRNICCFLHIKEIKYRKIRHNRFCAFNEGLKQKLKVFF
jgi:hypothetical protein